MQLNQCSSMQLRLPIARNATLRTGHRLILGMPARWPQLRAFDRVFGLVVVEPLFAGLKACDHPMTGFLEVRGRVLVRRTIAAADVPALGAAAEMEPPAAACQAFDAPGSGRCAGGIDVAHAYKEPPDRKEVATWGRCRRGIRRRSDETLRTCPGLVGTNSSTSTSTRTQTANTHPRRTRNNRRNLSWFRL